LLYNLIFFRFAGFLPSSMWNKTIEFVHDKIKLQTRSCFTIWFRTQAGWSNISLYTITWSQWCLSFEKTTWATSQHNSTFRNYVSHFLLITYRVATCLMDPFYYPCEQRFWLLDKFAHCNFTDHLWLSPHTLPSDGMLGFIDKTWPSSEPNSRFF
jgi:hypothetical protein